MSQRGVFFSIEIDGLSPQPFVVTSFHIHESLSAPLLGQISVSVRNSDERNGEVKAAEVVERQVLCRFSYDGQQARVLIGVCSQFVFRGRGKRYTRYELHIQSPIYRLGLRHNSRIFQQLTVPEIVSILLQERGVEEVAFSLRESHEAREYCVQYREDDLTFLQRLCAEEGIVFVSRHDQEREKEMLPFFDHVDGAERLPSNVSFNSNGALSRRMGLHGWNESVRVSSASVQARDYHFSRPHHAYQQESRQDSLTYQRDDYEFYDYPGRYQQGALGKNISRYRLEQLRRDTHVGEGESNVMAFSAGQRFELTGHPYRDSNRLWCVISVSHFGRQPQALEEDGSEGETTYNQKARGESVFFR